MALRALIENGSEGIRDTTSAEHNAMLGRISFLYQQNPPVELSVVSSNGNISTNMTDTRMKSGTAHRDTSLSWPDVTSFPSEGTTGEPELVTGVTYDKIEQTVSTPTPFTNSDYQSLNIKPVWLEADGVLREMDYNKVLTYFIDPIASAMVAASETASFAGGSYYISTTSSISGSTNLGTVFEDTKANLAGYHDYNIGDGVTAGQIYQDVFTTTPYYLQRVDSAISSQGTGYRTPLVIDYTANSHNQPSGLRHMTYAEFDSLFEPLVQYALHSLTGYRLRYNINGAGTTQGTVIANTQLIGGSGNYTTYKATSNDYRAQEFPDGTLVAVNTFELNLERT